MDSRDRGLFQWASSLKGWHAAFPSVNPANFTVSCTNPSAQIFPGLPERILC
jgi:hypothetical protein